MRIDFLMVDDRYYLNELTLYAGSGFGRVKLPERDLALGRMWPLPRGSRPFRRPGLLSRLRARFGLRGKGKGRT
ncbi:hypothetical protein [Aliigemmobacter aestuarii]|nr:hypothetical protein [Gemmobacter aestuarii]